MKRISLTPYQAGVLYALMAFGIWGMVPVYFKALHGVSSLEVLAHRIVWSVPVTALIIAANRDWGSLKRAFASKRILCLLVLTAALIGTNWLLFIYAVSTGKVLQSSLGYYINPLVNVLLGVSFFYLLWLGTQGQGALGVQNGKITVLLLSSGVITTLPLVWFTTAARRLRLSTVGILQYLAPSLHFFLAVFVYGEPFTLMHLITFSLIWTGVGLFMVDSLRWARGCK